MHRVKRRMQNGALWLIALLFAMAANARAQSPYISRVVEYFPAPGQFTNTAAWGTPAKAQSLIGGLAGGISLGGFGGYIVVGFDHRIDNHPDNPYGVDFTVFGNPLATAQNFVIWSEPGAVSVMKDENGNGLADDTWYELAGSDYYFSSTVRNYQITYTNPKQVNAADVPWADNQGRVGYILKNDYHFQPYYPQAAPFPGVDQRQITFAGNKIKGYVDRSDPSYIQAYKRGFGYADNALAAPGSHVVPDNPYTPAIEGAGGDAFDIDWAIDANGDHIHLDGIDFIRIYTAQNDDAGWLGEVSTEIRGIADVAPDIRIQGELDQVVMADIPRKVRENMQIPLEAYAFHKGILQADAAIIFSVDKDAVAGIDPGMLVTKGSGRVTITAALKANPAVKTQTTIDIVSPKAIKIVTTGQAIRRHARAAISATVLDQNGTEIAGVALAWRTSDASVLDIGTQGEQIVMRGKSEGIAWLIVSANDIPNLKDSVLIQVLPEAETRLVYLTIKDKDGLVISRRQVAVNNFDLNAYVDHRSEDYGIDKVNGVTVAHAIAQLFTNEDFASDLRFRDDDKGGGRLYLWRVPKGDASGISYVYGYGGTMEYTFDKAWFVRVNERTYVNGLHNVPVSEGDEIIVYPVERIGVPWLFIKIHSDKDTVDVEAPVALTVIRFEQSINPDRTVNTLSSDAVADARVSVNGRAYPNDSASAKTDELGKVIVTFSSRGTKNITVAGEACVVVVRSDIPVGIGDESEQDLAIYPNPFQSYLRLEGAGTNAGYTLMTLSGAVQQSGRMSNETTLSTAALPAGMYLLRIETGAAIHYVKLVKQ
ncbi:T9SS type A sorting domain-containing protein [Dawidia soli]|uniref:T9SS type A sorting domain-containing protein n=1 Tax=Dawidia soli TaxID=2782352 RepID=A0AAP2DBU2_9BACT|nr:T9SS type A sorting domain-containing protein [Dawidia soli]MBT1689084.1 T9SS type A sorting domain-containing protein [Dawidia soli]